MNKFVLGGAVVAALFAYGPLSGQTPDPASPSPKHPRRNFFAADQSRADVPARVQRIFAALDLNHDGFVTRDELAASQSRFDQRTTAGAPKRAAKMFDKMDTNRDDKVTVAEVEAARTARSRQAKASHALPSLFRLADADKDGVVTRSEFDAAVAAGKLKPRHAHMRGNEIARLFGSADADKDGRLSLEEARQPVVQRFDAMDANHDGVVTGDERRRAGKLLRGKPKSAS